MKNKLTFCLLTGLSALAHAFQPVINENEKKVYYTAQPTLQVTITEYEPGKAFLSLSYNYDTTKMGAAFQALGAQNKGYELVGLLPHATDDFEVSVPAIRFVQRSSTLQSQYGPYADWSTMLTGSQLRQLRAAMKSGRSDVFQVKAPVEVSYQQQIVTDEVTAPGSDCEALLGKDHDLQSLILNLAEYRAPSVARDPGTLRNLRKHMLRDCFQVSAPAPLESVTDLFAVKLVSKVPAKVTGRSYKTVEQAQEFNQDYDVQISAE